MWFALSLLALCMLSSRRAAEKKAATGIDSMAMAWLQQGVALPLIIASLFFAKFYWPGDLKARFWQLLVLYIALQAIYLYCYYQALAIADVGFVASIMTLFSVGNLIGAYIVLDQVPSIFGVAGAAFIVTGAFIIARAKRRQHDESTAAHKKALVLILIALLACSWFSNIEVLLLRMSNPTSFNFYSSLLTVPFVILVSVLVLKGNGKNTKHYWTTVASNVKVNALPLLIVGFTYTINMLATYQAKIIAPNAAYVGTIKAASVLPIVLLGMFFFKERVTQKQWVGIGLMLVGLAVMAINL